MRPTTAITLGIVVAISLAGVWAMTKIHKLEKEVLELQAKQNTCMGDKMNCKLALTQQSEALEELKLVGDERERELEDWRNKPEQVKYIDVIKYIPKTVNVKRSNCEDVSKYLEGVKAMEIDKW